MPERQERKKMDKCVIDQTSFAVIRNVQGINYSHTQAVQPCTNNNTTQKQSVPREGGQNLQQNVFLLPD